MFLSPLNFLVLSLNKILHTFAGKITRILAETLQKKPCFFCKTYIYTVHFYNYVL